MTFAENTKALELNNENMKQVLLRIKDAMSKISLWEFRVKDMGNGQEEAEQLFRAMHNWTTPTYSAFVTMQRTDENRHTFNVTAYMEDSDIPGTHTDFMLVKVFDPYYFTSTDRVMNKLVKEPMIRNTFRFNYRQLTEADINKIAEFLVAIHTKLNGFPFPATSSI